MNGGQLSARWEGTVATGPGTHYLRAEVETWLPATRNAHGTGRPEALEGRALAMTNPLWLEGNG